MVVRVVTPVVEVVVVGSPPGVVGAGPVSPGCPVAPESSAAPPPRRWGPARRLGAGGRAPVAVVAVGGVGGRRVPDSAARSWNVSAFEASVSSRPPSSPSRGTRRAAMAIAAAMPTAGSQRRRASRRARTSARSPTAGRGTGAVSGSCPAAASAAAMAASRRSGSTGPSGSRIGVPGLAQPRDPGQQRGIALDPARLLGRRLAVEVGGGELVEPACAGDRGSGRSWAGRCPWGRRYGRTGSGSRFPPSEAASSERPRAIRDRTVPGGIPSASAISAYSRSHRSRSTTATRNSSGRSASAASTARRSGSASMPTAVTAGVRGSAVEVLREPGDGAPAATAELVEARVRGHPVGPGAEGGAAVEPGQPADDGEEGLLGGVEGVGLVAGQSPAQAEDPVVVPAEQRVERVRGRPPAPPRTRAPSSRCSAIGRGYRRVARGPADAGQRVPVTRARGARRRPARRRRPGRGSTRARRRRGVPSRSILLVPASQVLAGRDRIAPVGRGCAWARRRRRRPRSSRWSGCPPRARSGRGAVELQAPGPRRPSAW